MPRAIAPLLIKKYPNRRLYDTVDSQYITLEQLEERIRAGAEATVVDAQSGDDLTAVTLLQIIEKNGGWRMMPVPLLRQLVRMRDDQALAEFLSRSLTMALETYLQARQGLQALTPYNPFATLPLQATNALARLMLHAPWLEPPAAPLPYTPQAIPAPTPHELAPASATPDATSEELAELRRQIAELRRDLGEPHKASTAGRGKRGRR